jgi:hypothetical protein
MADQGVPAILSSSFVGKECQHKSKKEMKNE